MVVNYTKMFFLRETKIRLQGRLQKYVKIKVNILVGLEERLVAKSTPAQNEMLIIESVN